MMTLPAQRRCKTLPDCAIRYHPSPQPMITAAARQRRHGSGRTAAAARQWAARQWAARRHHGARHHRPLPTLGEQQQRHEEQHGEKGRRTDRARQRQLPADAAKPRLRQACYQRAALAQTFVSASDRRRRQRLTKSYESRVPPPAGRPTCRSPVKTAPGQFPRPRAAPAAAAARAVRPTRYFPARGLRPAQRSLRW